MDDYPDFFAPGRTELDPNEVQQALIDSARAARVQQARGVEIMPQPTQLPPLNMRALLNMNPIDAAQIVQNRKLQQERNRAADLNYQLLQERDYRARTDELRHNRVLQDYQAKVAKHEQDAANTVKTAGPVLAENLAKVKSEGDSITGDYTHWNQTLQQLAARGHEMSLINQPDRKLSMDPKTGQFSPFPATFTPVSVWDPTLESPSKVNDIEKKRVDNENLARQKLAEAFNRAIETAKQKAIEASDKYKEWLPQYKTLESLLSKPVGGSAFIVDPKNNVLVHPATRQTFPINAATPAASSKPRRYNPATGELE